MRQNKYTTVVIREVITRKGDVRPGTTERVVKGFVEIDTSRKTPR